MPTKKQRIPKDDSFLVLHNHGYHRLLLGLAVTLHLDADGLAVGAGSGVVEVDDLLFLGVGQAVAVGVVEKVLNHLDNIVLLSTENIQKMYV